MKRLCQKLRPLIINDLLFADEENCTHPVQKLSGFDTVPLPVFFLNCSFSDYYLTGIFMAHLFMPTVCAFVNE